MNERFIIKDDSKGTIEIVPSIGSFDLLVANVFKMMSVGMQIQQCSFLKEQEADVKNNKFLTGYNYEEGLYDRLLWEYEVKTGESGKREMLRKW